MSVFSGYQMRSPGYHVRSHPRAHTDTSVGHTGLVRQCFVFQSGANPAIHFQVSKAAQGVRLCH